jgi:hypothetical protein
MVRRAPSFLALVLITATTVVISGQSTWPPSVAAQLRRLPSFPSVDEARQEPDLEAVRNEVLAAVRAKDVKRLMGFVSSSLVVDGERSDENWPRLEHWLLSVPHAEDWGLLERALSLGGAFTTTRGAVEGRREFCAPYVYARCPLWADIPENVQGERLPSAVVVKAVDVHAKPDLRSRVLGRIGFVMVQAGGLDAPDPSDPSVRWNVLNFEGEQEAYVRAETIQDPEGPNVCFAQDSKRWMVSSFDRRGTVR